MDGTQQLGISRPAQARRGSAPRVLLLIALLASLAWVPGDRMSPPPAPPRSEAEPRPTPTAPALLPSSDLIYRIPADIRQHCIPVDHGDLPFQTLECSEGLSRAFYTRYVTVEAMDRHFDDLVGPLNLPQISGGCRAGIPSRDEWHYTHSPDRQEGRMACFMLPDNAPATVVTQPEQRLLSLVISNPSLGWPGHHESWSKRVPNPPTDRQPPRPPS